MSQVAEMNQMNQMTDEKNHKAEAFFVSFEDEHECKSKSQSVSENLDNNCNDDFCKHLRQVAIRLRLPLMSMPFVLGVSVRKMAGFDHFVITARVGNDFHEWTQLPNFLNELPLNEVNARASMSGNKGSVLAAYSIMEETNNGPFQQMKFHDTPVVLCVVREDFHIASLKPPSNMIKPTKTHGLSY
jgi:hypothetical protein